MGQPKIDICITSNIPIIISFLGSSNVSEKQIILRELDLIQQVYKNHPADHYMSTPKAIDYLSLKLDCSTIQAYIQLTYIQSFIKLVLPKD